jgi:dipeptidyl aminopeptidase/acylaminoacyl peptidase
MPAALARAALAAAVAASAGCMPPSWGAAALLHPHRRPPPPPPALAHEDVTFAGDGGVELRGWLFRAPPPRKGAIVFLHGVADNRGSGVSVAARYVAKGYDVLAYDSRAHGASGGDACTYGYYEKRDLARALDLLHAERAVVVGVSMGAAVGLQAAVEDPRVAGVFSIATFSDLRTAARERAPVFATDHAIREAFALAEAEAHFRVDDVSPEAAAPRIRAPVVLVHGTDDHETPPAHSERVARALAGPHELVLVPDANHRNVLRGDVWTRMDRFIGAILPP